MGFTTTFGIATKYLESAIKQVLQKEHVEAFKNRFAPEYEKAEQI